MQTLQWYQIFGVPKIMFLSNFAIILFVLASNFSVCCKLHLPSTWHLEIGTKQTLRFVAFENT